MIATLKSEFKKLLTVRSTYFAALLVFLFTGFMALYIEGYRGLSGSAAATASTHAYRELVYNAIPFAAFVTSIIAVLFVVHEYRYNLINYTLTLSKSRTKVLAAKTIVVACYAVVFALLTAGLAIILYHIGLAIRGASLASQTFNAFEVLGKALFFAIGYGLLGLIFGFLVRSIAFALAIIFIAPTTIEPLFGLLLKNNAKYLPFSSLQNVLGMQGGPAPNILSPGRAMVVFAFYAAVGWVVVWFLFNRRDAN